jgi:hypothetical protein
METNSLLVLFRRVLASQGNEALLSELLARSREVLVWLRDGGSTSDLENELPSGVAPEWLARVYEAIAGVDSLRDDRSARDSTRQALVHASESVEGQIGSAFAEILLEGLPRGVADLSRSFAAAPQASETERKHLLETASAREAGPSAEPLAARGLTPLGVFYATEVLYPLVGQLVEGGLLPKGRVVLSVRDPPPGCDHSQLVPVDLVVREFARVAKCKAQVARVLLGWLIAVAQAKPLVFRGAKATPVENAIKLMDVGDAEKMTLTYRWGHQATAPTPVSVQGLSLQRQ